MSLFCRLGRAIAALLLFCASLSGCRAPAEPPDSTRPSQAVTVQIGYQKTGAPFLLKARADKLEARLAKHGAQVRWIEFQAGPPILEAMRGAAVDIGHTGEAPPIFAQSGGVPFVYVASDPPSPAGEAIVVPTAGPRTVAELKGKRIALNRGSNVHYLLLRALGSAGLTLDDVQTVYLAPSDARSAFESGKVDAWVIWDPFLAAAELKGARVLASGEGLVENRFYYLARRAFAEQHPELLEIVLSEFAELSEWATDHAEQASQLLAAASGIAYEALLLSEKRHVYGLKPIDETILAKQQVIADAFVGLKLIPQAVRTSDARFERGRPKQVASQP